MSARRASPCRRSSAARRVWCESRSSTRRRWLTCTAPERVTPALGREPLVLPALEGLEESVLVERAGAPRQGHCAALDLVVDGLPVRLHDGRIPEIHHGQHVRVITLGEKWLDDIVEAARHHLRSAVESPRAWMHHDADHDRPVADLVGPCRAKDRAERGLCEVLEGHAGGRPRAPRVVRDCRLPPCLTTASPPPPRHLC